MQTLNIRDSDTQVEESVVIKELFNKKYKTIIDFGFEYDYMEILDWVQWNTKKSVDIKIHNSTFNEKNKTWVLNSIGKKRVFVGFESLDDALLFKVKYAL